ncbi:MAG: hypothetical protein NXI04_28560 [Planctomycetaceae bacterium]|nr:hypothetical protein [Planctomycetaceae bacterium]
MNTPRPLITLPVRLLCLLTFSALMSTVSAAPPAPNTGGMGFRDIRLGDGGQLRLQVVSPAGQPIARQIVSIQHEGKEIARSQTSPQGQVLIRGLRPGLHLIQVGRQQLNCRLWTARTAPPTALANPAFVLGGTAVRGQYGPVPGPLFPNVAPAALATTVTAAAVAAIIIGKNSGDDSTFVPPASP